MFWVLGSRFEVLAFRFFLYKGKKCIARLHLRIRRHLHIHLHLHRYRHRHLPLPQHVALDVDLAAGADVGVDADVDVAVDVHVGVHVGCRCRCRCNRWCGCRCRCGCWCRCTCCCRCICSCVAGVSVPVDVDVGVAVEVDVGLWLAYRCMCRRGCRYITKKTSVAILGQAVVLRHRPRPPPSARRHGTEPPPSPSRQLQQRACGPMTRSARAVRECEARRAAEAAQPPSPGLAPDVLWLATVSGMVDGRRDCAAGGQLAGAAAGGPRAAPAAPPAPAAPAAVARRPHVLGRAGAAAVSRRTWRRRGWRRSRRSCRPVDAPADDGGGMAADRPD